MNSLGFGITITVSGNFKSALKDAEKGVDRLDDKLDNLKDTQADAATAAATISTALSGLGSSLANISKGFFKASKFFIGAVGNILNAGARLEQQLLGLEVFFGDDTETMAGAILAIANASDIALEDVTAIGKRLGGLKLPIQESARATRVLTQAISTLAGQERTRALNGVSNILEDINSASKLLNVSFSQTEKATLKSLSSQEKQLAILTLLEERFGTVNLIMKRGFLFALRQASQLIDVFFAQLSRPVLKKLTKPLGEIVNELNLLVEGADEVASIFKPLREAMEDLLRPIVKILEFVRDINFVPRFFTFLASNAQLIKNLFKIAIATTAILGVMTGLAAVVILVLSGLFALAAVITIFSGVGAAAMGVALLISAAIVIMLVQMAVIITSLGFLFRRTFGEAGKFLGRIIGDIILLSEALSEAFAKGELTEGTFKKLEKSGLITFFKGLFLVVARLADFFGGMQGAADELVEAVKPAFLALRESFIELGSAFGEILMLFGLGTEGGSAFAAFLGSAVIKPLVNALIFVITIIGLMASLVIGIIALLRSVANAVEFVFKGLAGIILASIGNILLALSKIPGFGGLEDTAIALSAGGSQLLGEAAQAGKNSLELGKSAFTGKKANVDTSEVTAGDDTAATIKTQIILDRQVVAESQRTVSDEDLDENNGVPIRQAS